MSRQIKREIENSSIITIPNAGHLINIEAPEIFNKNLMSFLES
jgi:pimeloyl-ACP methyl ester carboxylesterase